MQRLITRTIRTVTTTTWTITWTNDLPLGALVLATVADSALADESPVAQPHAVDRCRASGDGDAAWGPASTPPGSANVEPPE